MNCCDFFQPKRKQFDDFFDGFDAQCASTGLLNTVPACVKKLLTLTGYNSALSFKQFTEGELDSTERFIEENHRNIADEFDEYKNVRPFKFLPGHKALIFGIKSQLEDFQAKQKITKKVKRSVPNENELHIALLNQISSFAKDNQLEVVFSTDCIKQSLYTATENASFCSCNIICPLCFSSIGTRYDKYWKNTNVYKHLRTHLTSKRTANHATKTRPSSIRIEETAEHLERNNIEMVTEEVLVYEEDENLVEYILEDHEQNYVPQRNAFQS